MADNVIRIDFRPQRTNEQIRDDAERFIREVRSRLGGFDLHDAAGVSAIVEASEAVVRAAQSQPPISAAFLGIVSPEVRLDLERQLNEAAGAIAMHWATAMASAAQAAVYRTLFNAPPPTRD